jgi:Ni/Co efflux regulator RcnB
MKRICKILAFTTLAMIFTGGLAFAQRHDDRNHYDNHRYVRHNEWRRGARMNNRDWNRGERIDYRRYRLSAPPRGYEWRQVDGNYVLAAAATGLIATIIAASAAH